MGAGFPGLLFVTYVCAGACPVPAGVCRRVCWGHAGTGGYEDVRWPGGGQGLQAGVEAGFAAECAAPLAAFHSGLCLAVPALAACPPLVIVGRFACGLVGFDACWLRCFHRAGGGCLLGEGGTVLARGRL